MTLQTVLNEAINLTQFKNKEPEAVKFLMMELSGYTGTEFYLKLNKPIDKNLKERFYEALEKYLNQDIPVQHILGYTYFYGRKFQVSPDVLIPRRETEELVEHVLKYKKTYFKEDISFIDIGCGSGAISITLALEDENMKGLAVDISSKALEVAKKNNRDLKAQLSFKESDLFSNITQKFDIIVSNPPYIPEDEMLDEIVKKEPHLALFGGKEGLDFYERILKDAKPYLNEKALIAFEHGYQQKEAIKNLALKYFKEATIIQKKDLQERDRFTFIGLKGVLE